MKWSLQPPELYEEKHIPPSRALQTIVCPASWKSRNVPLTLHSAPIGFEQVWEEPNELSVSQSQPPAGQSLLSQSVTQ